MQWLWLTGSHLPEMLFLDKTDGIGGSRREARGGPGVGRRGWEGRHPVFVEDVWEVLPARKAFQLGPWLVLPPPGMGALFKRQKAGVGADTCLSF